MYDFLLVLLYLFVRGVTSSYDLNLAHPHKQTCERKNVNNWGGLGSHSCPSGNKSFGPSSIIVIKRLDGTYIEPQSSSHRELFDILIDGLEEFSRSVPYREFKR